MTIIGEGHQRRAQWPSVQELGENLEKVVTDLVENGRSNSKSEVLREGVRLV